ncbi:hypothetical protein BD779DRAFT_1486077 [Infundibulicybe gibba]|nr:hypothetical protein BD779DRAFT_1486077 [Infundibulicybe gibba]
MPSIASHDSKHNLIQMLPLPSPPQLASPPPPRYPRIRRLLLYIRGPRPKISLSDPVPLLDIDTTIRGRHIHLPIESTFLRYTRPLTRPWLFVVLVAAYIVSFTFFSRAQSFLTPASSFIGCSATYWPSLDSCGLDGILCRPFDNETFDFRCPAQCDNLILQNPRTVGNEQVVFKPLIVGGGDPDHTYRGDSFICGAALQAGLISKSKGGCASLELIGNFTDFLPASANGLTSLGFPTVFPLSFRFLPTTSLTHCTDYRNPALAFNILVTLVLFTLLRPKPIILFWSIFCIGFWHISLFSQPQSSPPPISTSFGIFLPALFIAYAFWRLAIRFTLPVFTKAPLEAAIWYLTPFWVGVLTNLTTDRLPLSRLTASDINKRSGAIVVLLVIVAIIFAAAVNQVRVMRKTGWLPRYLAWYVAGGLVTLVLALLPGMQLRIHHYFLAMVLMPGTAFPTRACAVFQGYLTGLFLNGAAAFGFDPILQTATELRQDAPLGSALPMFLTNASNYNVLIPFVNQTIAWAPLPADWDGFALLVDDVERYVGSALTFSLAAFNASVPHFFRLAYTSDGEAGDFTMPAVLWPNGTWFDPLPGPS